MKSGRSAISGVGWCLSPCRPVYGAAWGANAAASSQSQDEAAVSPTVDGYGYGLLDTSSCCHPLGVIDKEECPEGQGRGAAKIPTEC